MTSSIYINSNVTSAPSRDTGRAPQQFHQRMPGYVSTPLLDVPQLARALGVGAVWIKNEAQRLGMPSFKILGASYATYRALEALVGGFAPWHTLDQLAAQCAVLRPLTLAAATDGNHGRAVARMAQLLGFAAHIFVPAGTAPSRIDAIAGEGAQVSVVDGTYDDAIARSAQEAGPRCLVISDTSWPGYETVPSDVIDGYTTMFWEVDDELARRGAAGPDLVVVQLGVGALAAAATNHYRHASTSRPMLLGVEPGHAACVLRSMQAGKPVEVPGPHDSIMAGLNCGMPSLIAWPIISRGIDAFLAIDDQRACQAVRDLAAAGIVAGETGAAGLGGLTEALMGPNNAALRVRLALTDQTRVLLISTEGATDPVARGHILAADCARDCLVRQACKRG